MLCRLTDVRHSPSEPPAKTFTDGDRRERWWCEVRPPPAVHDCHGRRSRQKTRRCRSSVTKKHRRCSRRKSSINITQWGVVRLVVVQGVESTSCPAWSLYGCPSTYWYTYTLGCPSNFFFVLKSGGGGESKQILREYGFKKTSKITDDPLSSFFRCTLRTYFGHPGVSWPKSPFWFSQLNKQANLPAKSPEQEEIALHRNTAKSGRNAPFRWTRSIFPLLGKKRSAAYLKGNGFGWVRRGTGVGVRFSARNDRDSKSGLWLCFTVVGR